MHPGSGPSDRDNDVFFPPIREHLLAAGIAVSSFDKRGVGGSTGRWQEAAIVEQASDANCCLELLQGHVGGQVGLFGHSQGGWVVIEAAAHSPEAAFAISSSGPGVTPEQQERYATQLHMKRAGISEEEIEEVRRYYDDIVAMMRAGASLEDAKRRVEEGGFPQAFATLSLPVLPDDAAEWKLLTALIDYDPRPALERIRVPLLADLRRRRPDHARRGKRRRLPRGGPTRPPGSRDLCRCGPPARGRRPAEARRGVSRDSGGVHPPGIRATVLGLRLIARSGADE